MSVPYIVVKRLVLLSFIGYVILTVGVLAGSFWWQYRTDHKQEQILEAVVGAQEDGCRKGNTIRLQMREDNEEAIRTTLDLLSGSGLSKDQRVAYKKALDRRLERREALVTYDCSIHTR